MLFNSYIFVLLFLPVCILGYFFLNNMKKYNCAMAFLLGMSLWFYGYNNPSYLIIIVGSILGNYLFYRLVYGSLNNGKCDLARIYTTIGVILNLCNLFYFKYMDFFIGNMNRLIKTDFNLLHIVLPLGISFFTFQQISFLVDTYKGEVKEISFLYYATFVAFFPQLIAGPIVTAEEMLPQFSDENKKKIQVENVTHGLYLFTLGMAKKVLIANRFSSCVEYCYTTIQSLNSLAAMIMMLGYTIQIYFDFSGYCDMAVGIGRMLNIDIPVNFNSPYKSVTIAEFWERWHITLTRFFTRYIYIPLGGSRKGKARTYFNIMVVFLASGLWHGADWKFVVWGLMHGVFMVIYRMGRKVFDKIPRIINWVITFLFINVSWLFFRAPSISTACLAIKKICAWNFRGFDEVITKTFDFLEIRKAISIIHLNTRFPHIILISFFVISFYFMTIGKNAIERTAKFQPTLIKALSTVFFLIWSICLFAGMNEFIYFNF